MIGKRRKKLDAAEVVTLLVAAWVIFLLNAGFFMLLFGAIAPVFGWPTLSYGKSCVAVGLLGIVGGIFRGPNLTTD